MKEKTHFEIMQELGQMSLFHTDCEINKIKTEKVFLEKFNLTSKEIKENIYVGSKVEIILSEIESNDILYFEGYEPEALQKPGTVMEIIKGLFYVKFKNNLVPMKRNEIKLSEEMN